jgi:regulator of protease activity HflC (stomatin/prohibitin superfamily)
MWIEVTALNIIDFQFSEDFNNAIEQKVKAEQEALTQKNKLEQVKYEAEQRVAQATAEAKAILIQAQAIQSNGGQNYVNLKWIEKWNGAVAQYQLWSNTSLYMPMK